jgi:hypothetical protein
MMYLALAAAVVVSLLAVLALYSSAQTKRFDSLILDDSPYILATLWWAKTNLLRVEVRLRFANHSIVPKGVSVQQVLFLRDGKWLPLEPSLNHYGSACVIPARQFASPVFYLEGRASERPSKGDCLELVLAVSDQPNINALVLLPSEPTILL